MMKTTAFCLINLLFICSAFAVNSNPSGETSSSKHWKRCYARVDIAKRRYKDHITSQDFSKRPKKSNILGIGVGYRFTNYPARFELSVQKNHFNVNDTLTAKVTAYFFNFYRDFPWLENHDNNYLKKIVPYLGAGAGKAFYKNTKYLQTSGTTINLNKKNKFAWNAGMGVNINLNKFFAIDLGYRYVMNGEVNTNKESNKVGGHQGLISVITNFE